MNAKGEDWTEVEQDADVGPVEVVEDWETEILDEEDELEDKAEVKEEEEEVVTEREDVVDDELTEVVVSELG